MATEMADVGGAGGQGQVTAWRVASATCSTNAGFNESHSVSIAEGLTPAC